jgi:hypothetical protein
MGVSATSRSPQGLQPLRRTILVVIASQTTFHIPIAIRDY